MGAAPQGGRCRHPANGDCPQASQAGGSKSAQQEPGGLTWCGRPARLPPPWRCGALGGRRRRRCCGCYRGQRQVTQRAQRTVSWHSTPSGDVCFGEHPPCACRGEAGRGSHESMHLLVLCRAAAACRRQQRPPGGPAVPAPASRRRRLWGRRACAPCWPVRRASLAALCASTSFAATSRGSHSAMQLMESSTGGVTPRRAAESAQRRTTSRTVRDLPAGRGGGFGVCVHVCALCAWLYGRQSHVAGLLASFMDGRRAGGRALPAHPSPPNPTTTSHRGRPHPPTPTDRQRGGTARTRAGRAADVERPAAAGAQAAVQPGAE